MAKSRVPGARTSQQLKSDLGLSSDSESDETQPDIPRNVNVAPEVKAFDRVFTKTTKIVSDVFKLKVAEVIKQVGPEKDPNKDPDSFRPFEHTHVFRTFDSDGKRHDKCCATAGHFHEIKWEYDKDNKPQVRSVSGPMTMSRKQIKGKWTQVAVPANSYDEHTHDFLYLQSVEVSARNTNLEAQKVIALDAQKGAPVAGVVAR